MNFKVKDLILLDGITKITLPKEVGGLDIFKDYYFSVTEVACTHLHAFSLIIKVGYTKMIITQIHPSIFLFTLMSIQDVYFHSPTSYEISQEAIQHRITPS